MPTITKDDKAPETIWVGFYPIHYKGTDYLGWHTNSRQTPSFPYAYTRDLTKELEDGKEET